MIGAHARPDGMVDRIRQVSRRSATLGLVPSSAVSLAMGEPGANTADRVVDAAIASLRAGRTHYAPMAGSSALREALAASLRTPQRPVGLHEVAVTHGGSAGLAATIFSLVGPGDRVVLPEPTYSLYADQVAAAGGEVVWSVNRPDGGPDLDALAELLPIARLVILCNPGNPTGYVLTQAELGAVLELAQRHGTYVLCDEAYRDIVYDGRFCSSLDLPECGSVICCGTFSKTHAMTGWRVGWLVAPREIADRIRLMHQTFNGPLNTFIQDAALMALQSADDERDEMLASYRARRDQVVEALTQVERVSLQPPQGAFYAFPKVELPLRSEDLAARLAEAGVLVRAGSEFGPSGEGHIRISYAAGSDDVAEGLRRFARTIAHLVDELGQHETVEPV
jgi:aspartate aminotransferase